jgi:hypothetical protein
MLNKAQISYSFEVSDPARRNFFNFLLVMWWPDGARMTWINWPPTTQSNSSEDLVSDDDPREHVGFTNASLPRNLDKLLVHYVEAGRLLDIDADKYDPAAQEALRRSGLEPDKNDIDIESPIEILDADTTQREDTA